MTKLKAIHGTAIYTGGGFYSVIGELNNGLYFNGCNDWCSIFDTDTRQEDENGDLCCFNVEWCEAHEVESDPKEVIAMFKDFCERLDKGEKDITKGYEKYSNYLRGEVTECIDFDYFEALNG